MDPSDPIAPAQPLPPATAAAGTATASAAPAAEAEDAAFPFWRRNTRLLYVCNLLSNIGFTLYFPFVPLIFADLGVREGLEGWVGAYNAVLYAATMALMPVWGGMADHFGKRSMMLRASMGQVLGFSVMAFAPGPGMLLLLVFWIGASNGFNATSQALIATNTPAGMMGRALSSVQSGSLIGSTLGPVLGGLLVNVLPGYQWLYLIGGGIATVTTTLVLVAVQEVRQPPQGRFRLHLLQDLQRCLRVPGLGLLYLLMFLFASTFFGSLSIVSLYTLELLDGAPQFLGLSRDLWLSAVAVALTLSSAAALPVWGRLLDRLEPRRVTLVALGLGVLATLPYPLVRDPLQLTGVRLLLGLGMVGMQPALLRLIKGLAPPGMDARALAFGTSLYMLGHGAAPFMAGLLAPSIGLRGYFVVHSLLLALGFALWLSRGVRAPRA